MNTMQRNKYQSVALTAMLSIALISGCEQAEQTVDLNENQAHVDQPERPLGHVAEFEGFTIRANVSPTEFLPDAMIRQHDIEAGPDIVQLNVVILEKRPDGQLVAVSAQLSAHYENDAGKVEVIDMRAVKANGLVSYMSTLDTSTQQVFRFFIEALPEGTDQPLKTNFEVKLPEPDIG